MKAVNPKDLPPVHTCNVCALTKPVEEMQVTFHRKEKIYYLRPRCKDCHNKKERGHRKEWKRKYQQEWRKRNKDLNDSYWKGNEEVREQARIRAAKRLKEKHDAILIQGRLRRHGRRVTLKEAERLLKRFGRCYPTRYGLTPEGLKECERIRSRMRLTGNKLRLTALDIRIMVYEDGLFMKPSHQLKHARPYRRASENLLKFHRTRRAVLEAG